MADDGPVAQSIAIGFRVVAAAVAVLAASWAVSNWRQVPPDSQAVVLRFGRIAGVQPSGLAMAWPRPMGDVVLLPGRDRLLTLRTAGTARLGGLQDVYTEASGASLPDGAGAYLTADGGLILLAATLSYRVDGAADYALAREHVEPALRRSFEAAAVHVAATRPLEDFLATRAATDARQARREALRGDLVEAVNARLAALAAQGSPLGVAVARIDLEPALPPDARIAFDGVLVAGQLAEQAVAAARTQAARTLQAAEQERDRVLTEARANAAERVAAARVRTASVAAIQAGFGAGPGIGFGAEARPAMLDQLYRERIAGIMHRVGRVVTVDRQAGRVIVPADLGPAP